MTKPSRHLALGLLLACGCAFAAEEAPSGPIQLDRHLTPENKARLDKGETILIRRSQTKADGEVSGGGFVMVIIDRPPAEVWPFILDWAKHPEFMPRIVAAEKYHEGGGEIGLKQTIKVMLNRITYHILQRHDPAQGTLSWKLDTSKKNEIKETHGSWMLRPWGEGKTLAAYTIVVDTGMIVPKFIQNYLLESDLPDVANALKKRSESNGEYKK